MKDELKFKIYPSGELKNLKFVVVCSYYDGKWMLSRHKNVIHGKRRAVISKMENLPLMRQRENCLKKAG